MRYEFLSCLNPAQSQCVEHPPALPLQILAGPGSGKTRVLTSRIAYLVLHHGIDPSSICAVTFTNKAANEMRTRLVKLLGKDKTNQIKLGTFHSICVLFLRKYGYLIGVEKNFTICDADESKKMVGKLLKTHEDFMASKDMTLKEGAVLAMISKAKAKGETPEGVRLKTAKSAVSNVQTFKQTAFADVQQVFADVYRDYQTFLRQSNSLDFDDLLVFGVELFSKHPRHTKWCHHILVDEFQDTNTIQYELMCCIASMNKCITVVGDPDQSIYGWRSAEVKNLARMQNDFTNVKQVFLEHNYRSAGSILAASMSIISQDNSRIPKTLRTSRPLGPRPMLRSFSTENDEASFLAYEINRLIAQTGGMLGYGDFAVLLRFNALSRMIETALQRERIPNRILGGHKFFERTEIKDLLAYLQLVDNPEFVPAFSRCVNIPSRGIGEKALGEIIACAQKLKSSPLSIVEQICDHKRPDLKLSVRRKVAPFVSTIRTLRKLAAEGRPPSELIRTLLKSIQYEEHLKKTQPDWELRWENVQELINFASEDVGDCGVGSLAISPDTKPTIDTPLRQFLQASMLSSDGDKSSGHDDGKVVITTCHAAKGLEWPVVIIPAVEKGNFPFYRSEDIEEERRLLYVACTRAQVMLYLTHALKRKSAGEQKTKDLTVFLSDIRHKNPPLFSDEPPLLSAQDQKLMAEILGREARLPNEDDSLVPCLQGNIFRNPRLKANWLPYGEDIPTGYVPMFQSRSRFHTPLYTHKTPARFKDQSASAAAESTVILATASKAVPGPETSSQQQLVSTNVDHLRILNTPASQPDLESQIQSNVCSPSPPSIGMKRRLGMGRVTAGYSNKKFKPPVT
ncbi:UvrD-helicase-domain-containing protein [Paxillus ammoniavirescens]|nr:UvrD-helicase-domain-containing protein [Paxillus ammoniavirescens]